MALLARFPISGNRNDPRNVAGILTMDGDVPPVDGEWRTEQDGDERLRRATTGTAGQLCPQGDPPDGPGDTRPDHRPDRQQ